MPAADIRFQLALMQWFLWGFVHPQILGVASHYVKARLPTAVPALDALGRSHASTEIADFL